MNDDAKKALDLRLASGEINKEEYADLFKTLKADTEGSTKKVLIVLSTIVATALYSLAENTEPKYYEPVQALAASVLYLVVLPIFYCLDQGTVEFCYTWYHRLETSDHVGCGWNYGIDATNRHITPAPWRTWCRQMEAVAA